MSLFKRRKRAAPIPTDAPTLSEPQSPKLVTPVDTPELTRIRAKVQAEVCAIMSRTILQQIQSRDAAREELLKQQSVNRLYADVLYDLLSSGAAPEIDPADRVQRWTRGALEDWGRSQTALSPDLAREREALVQSILQALAAAAQDKTLRTAAIRRVAADRLASGG
jgi:hypothetical protein